VQTLKALREYWHWFSASRGRMLGTLAALAVGPVLLAGWWAERHETDVRLSAMQSVLEVHALGLRGVVGKYTYLPAMVSRQSEVRAFLTHSRDDALRERVSHYLEDIAPRTGAAAVYVMDLNGVTLAASNWNTPDSYAGQNYSQRPYFQEARQGHSALVYGVGVTTGKPGLFIAEPIWNHEQILGVVVVKLALDSVASTWERSVEPVMLRDSMGVVFLATFPEWQYRLTRGLTPQETKLLGEEQLYGRNQALQPLHWSVGPGPRAGASWVDVRVKGQKRSYLSLDLPLPEWGWTLTVMTDRAEILQVRNQTWMMATLLTALLYLAGLYWRLRERRYAEQRNARRELEQRVQERTRELQEAHAFRKSMEDSLLVGMRARDLTGKIIYVNRALCMMMGYEAEELLGRRPPYPYWHPDDMAKHWRDSDAALRGQAEPSGFESRIRHKAGHDVVTMVYTAPLIDADGVQQGWMSSVVDITEQKRAEERQRAQEAQLQRAARLASLGEMASTLAHELNQPLMALSNFAAAAKALAEHGPPGLLVASLDDIQSQAKRASEIVKRIRGMVRHGKSSTECFAFSEVVPTVLAWLAPEIQARRVRVEHKIDPDLPLLCADRVLVEQLLLNLVMNALQVMDGQPLPRRCVEIAAHLGDDPQMCVTVADHGPGVAPEHAHKLFDAFFTTKPDGLGLGLKICRSIVESHGGQLVWRPRPEGGTVFEFTLPLQR
jgi:two-component system, LuxR family, sensor histidine kinase DctS